MKYIIKSFFKADTFQRYKKMYGIKIEDLSVYLDGEGFN